jgi:hypothetical protein
MRLPAQPLWLLLLLLLLCLTLFLGYAQRALDGWDSMAYIFAGRQLAAGEGLATTDPNNDSVGPYFGLSGYRLLREPGARLYLTFPPGFPVLLAAAQLLTGTPQAAFAVVPVFALLVVITTFMLGRALFDVWIGLAAALVLAFTPTFLTFATAPWSDVPAAALVLWATMLFVMGQRANSSQQGAVLGAVAGLCLSYGGFVRAISVLAGLALLAYGWYVQRRRLSHWANVAFAGVWVLGILSLLVFNRIYYGDFLGSGYTLQNSGYNWPFFSLSYAFGPSPADGRSLVASTQTLARDYSLLLLPALVGLWKMPRPTAILVLGLSGTLLVPYLVYAFAPSGINARFLVSAYPFIALAAGYGVAQIAGRLLPAHRDAITLAGASLGVVILIQPWTTLAQLAERNQAYEQTAAKMQALTAGMSSNAVFLAYTLGDPISFYGGRSVFYYRHLSRPDGLDGSSRPVEERLVEAVDRLLTQGIPVYFVDDAQPPLWNTPAILRQHYRLDLVQDEPPTYRIERPLGEGMAPPGGGRYEKEQSALLVGMIIR